MKISLKQSIRTLSSAFLLGLSTILIYSCDKTQAPKAIAPIPENKQVEWQKMETYAFVHFGLNTFNDREWGYGDSDPATFNPKKLDCEQWVQTFVNAGMKGVILTAKHHDGFCLWPTHLTEYCIRNTPYKDGKGDVVGELAAACRKYGIKFAVYLSPWDRHHPDYGTEKYVEFYHQQLRELMSSYGDVFEVWFDGANGGDGWYGGACDKRNIDRKHYYNYPKIYEILDELQPQAIVFSDGGPGCRWVGNEKGFAGATNWSFIKSGVVYPGYAKFRELQYGHPNGDQWVPAECDVSIRPGWFYHPEQDNQVKTVEQLTNLYYRSVGHNATLLLNFPIDRNGLINPIDSTNAVSFHKEIERQLDNNLLLGLRAEASNIRGNSSKFSTSKLTDGKYDSYWATDDDVTSADLTFELPKEEVINCVMLQEYIPLGQRVKSFKIEYLPAEIDSKADSKAEDETKTEAKIKRQSDSIQDNSSKLWLPVCCDEETTTIGYKRLVRFKAVRAKAIRIHFLDARASLCINNIAAFNTGTNLCADLNNKVNNASLSFTYINTQENCSNINNSKDNSSKDNNAIIIDLGEEKLIRSLYYLPDQSEYAKGLIHRFRVLAGKETTKYRELASGEFSNIKNNPIEQAIYFTPTKARYIKLEAIEMVTKGETPKAENIRVL